MYTIFFTINCVEQLTFFKTFVDQLQFKQLIFFCLKVKLLKIHVRQMIFHNFWFLSSWQKKKLLLEWCRAIIKSCRADFSSNQILSRWLWPLKSWEKLRSRSILSWCLTFTVKKKCFWAFTLLTSLLKLGNLENKMTFRKIKFQRRSAISSKISAVVRKLNFVILTFKFK